MRAKAPRLRLEASDNEVSYGYPRPIFAGRIPLEQAESEPLGLSLFPDLHLAGFDHPKAF